MDLLVAVHCSGFPGTRSKETLKPQMHTPEKKHKIICTVNTQLNAAYESKNIKESCSRISAAFIQNNVALNQNIIRLNSSRRASASAVQLNLTSFRNLSSLITIYFSSKWLSFVDNNCLLSFTNVMIYFKSAALKYYISTALE